MSMQVAPYRDQVVPQSLGLVKKGYLHLNPPEIAGSYVPDGRAFAIHLFKADRPVLVVGCSRGKAHDDRHATIFTGDRNRTILKHRLNKLLHLGHIAIDIAFHEEVERQITPDTVAGAEDRCVRVVILAGDRTFTAEHLDTLIV